MTTIDKMVLKELGKKNFVTNGQKVKKKNKKK